MKPLPLEFVHENIKIFKKNSIQRLSVNLLKCDFVANRLIDQYLYGENHPYGRISSKRNIELLRREDLMDYYNSHYLRAKCIIFAAGKLPVDFEDLLDENFGDLNIHEDIVTPTHKRKPEKERAHSVSNDKNGVQGAIRIARPFPSRKHPDFKSAMVLNTLFGGYFGSRLMANIREEKGYTYGIHSYVENHVEDTAWMVSTEAGKDVCGATIAEVYKEMRDLCEEPVNAEELLLVKNYMIGLNLSYIDGPFQTVNRWKGLVLNGLDENYFYESLEAVKTITPEALQELANKYLQPEAFYELVVI